ncbi:MAG: universal stress protein, partial [Alphaproteobacteria bacterium]
AEGHGQQPGADIALYLARHGVKAEAHYVVAPRSSSSGHRFSHPKVDVGDEVLSRAADFGADMIVMGAYGHSRLRELVLGGVTHHVFRHMTVPVVVSH